MSLTGQVPQRVRLGFGGGILVDTAPALERIRAGLARTALLEKSQVCLVLLKSFDPDTIGAEAQEQEWPDNRKGPCNEHPENRRVRGFVVRRFCLERTPFVQAAAPSLKYFCTHNVPFSQAPRPAPGCESEGPGRAKVTV